MPSSTHDSRRLAAGFEVVVTLRYESAILNLRSSRLHFDPEIEQNLSSADPAAEPPLEVDCEGHPEIERKKDLERSFNQL
jgi:hypothetical protein